MPTAKAARKSVVWAIGLIGLFYLFSLVLGFGAAALVGPENITKRSRRRELGGALLAYELGGTLLLGFISAVAFAVAASANLPTIVYSLFSKRFTTRGALWSIYGGLISSVTLIVFSPVVSGKPVDALTGKSQSMLQGVDFHWFPLTTRGRSPSRWRSSSAGSAASPTRRRPTRSSTRRWRCGP